MHTTLTLAIGILGILLAQTASAQSARSSLPARIASSDSATIAAGTYYDAGPLSRFLLGNTYRDYWIKPIRVPVLDLRTYAGGLEPLKEGGGKQTLNLRLGALDGSEFVFRPVNKATVNPPERLRGTIVEALFRDQVSAMYPAAGVVAAPLVEAAGVLHATPEFVVMPDDPLLGSFRERFITQLATIEAYPTKPEEGPGFGGAVEIIDSEELIPLLDSLPNHRVDDRAFLAARLTDFLLGDNDRHLGNWKWARFGYRKPGQRDALQAILLENDGGMPGCLSYVIAQDPADADALWITEVWNDQESHAASLTLPAVQQAIARARPLIAGFSNRVVTTPIGGIGLGGR